MGILTSLGFFLLLLAGRATAAENARAGTDAIQGAWQAVKVEHEGVPDSPEVVEHVKWTVKGARIVATEARTLTDLNSGRVRVLGTAGPKEATYSIDSRRSPRWLDVTFMGMTTKAIYRLDGDTLTVCGQDEPGGDRPTKFATRPDSGLHLFVLKRVK